MLEVSALRVAYGRVVALDGISLTVLPGSITTVLGANGAGKTTLVRAISGLVRPLAGSISWQGQEITRLATEEVARRGIAHVPQGQGIIGELSVEDNLRLGSLARRGREDRERAVASAYELFPVLGTRRRGPAANLSGGERQMLAIARALASGPRLLLLDEPSLGLAARVLAQIMAQLRLLVSRNGLAVLLIEQNARSALSVADRAVVLSLGQVVAQGPSDRVGTDRELLGAYLGF